jgi:hypothetical protein
MFMKKGFNKRGKNVKSRRVFILLSAFVCLCLLYGSPVYTQTTLQSDLNRSFTKFELVRLDSQESFSKVKDRKHISIPLAERIFELVLVPRDLRAPEYRAEITTSEGIQTLETGSVTTFKGKIANMPDSQVRISIDGTKIEGYFKADGEQYFIEPAKRYSKFADEKDHIVYRSGDFLNEKGISCQTEFAKSIEIGAEMFGVGNLKSQLAPQAFKVLKIATEADFELVTSAGGAAQANAQILNMLNMIEGTYESELNLTFTVVFQHGWTTATPFNDSSITTLLDGFKAYWQTNYPPTQTPRDLAFYFSGKTSRAGLGLAKFKQICNSDNAYALSGNFQNILAINVRLMAHEMGHVLGATHVEAAQGCANTLMNTIVGTTTALSFCAFSQNEIVTNVAINGGCLRDQNFKAVRFDFDGDKRSDIGIFRPGPAQYWYLRSSDNVAKAFQFGQSSDKMVPADYTGDGKIDIAFFRPSIGQWYVLRSEDSSFFAFDFGTNGDVPAPADFDGDGKADPAIFRSSSATWFILYSSGGTSIQQFGQSGDVPVVGDYDGDGRDDIANFRPSVAEWYINRSSLGFIGLQVGTPGDTIPIPADYTGDGLADIAFFKPSATGIENNWFILRSEVPTFFGFPFGVSTDIPVPGDYDGDGKADPAVFRSSDNIWYMQQTTAGFRGIQFGITDDVPIHAAYLP